jgi:hypothetical protein
MDKLPTDEIEEIVRRQKPGFHVSSKSLSGRPSRGGASDARSESAASTADSSRVETLRSKYLGDDASDEEENSVDEFASEAGAGYEAATGDANDDDGDDDEIIAVEPDTSAHPWDRGARPKAVVVSKKEKKIIGEQG